MVPRYSRPQMEAICAPANRYRIWFEIEALAAEEKGRIVVQPFTKEFIDSFCGIFKLKPGEKSAVQELLEDRDRERAREDRELAEDKRK